MPEALAELLTFKTAIVMALVAAAGCLRGFSGFGSAMLLAPTLAAVLPLTQAVPLIVLLEVALSIQLLPDAIKRVDRREILILTLAAFPGLAIGVWLLQAVPATALRLTLSAAIMLFLVLILLNVRRTGPVTDTGLSLSGMLSGIANGASGVGGPPVVLYYLAGNGDAATLRATVICYFFLLDLLSVGLFLFQGMIDIPALALSLLCTPPAVLGVWLGTRLFSRASEGTYRLVACVIIGTAAVLGPIF